jgi:peptide/nickel transport system substrate-binding protein
MRVLAWRWFVLSSLLLSAALLSPIFGALRPHYGGSLVVELSSPWTSLDPVTNNTSISAPVTETLLRINARGEIEPGLAVAWQHDPDFMRWRFSLRPKVIFHDGEALTAANAAPSLAGALKKRYGDVSIEVGGLALVVQSARPMPDLLEVLATPLTTIFRRNEGSPLIGTGPFRITTWEPVHKLALAAFDGYWGGRPYLDSVEFEFGSTHPHADLFDLPVGANRRILPEGITTWSSTPRSLVAILASPVNPLLLQALELSIDRAPIANVLAQRKGEVAFSLLPQWLSGYAFLFQSSPDVTRAKQLMSQLHAGPVSLSYSPNDAFLRSVAERVALNARDAGITVQPTANPNSTLRLVEWPLESTDAATELRRIAEHVELPDGAGHLDSSKPESFYEFERSLLDEHRIIPLIYLAESYGIAPRVHFQPSATSSDTFTLHLQDAWIQPSAQP